LSFAYPQVQRIARRNSTPEYPPVSAPKQKRFGHTPEYQGTTAYTSCLFQIHFDQKHLMLHLLVSVHFDAISEAMTVFFLPR
jgi:hypothetical protein